MLTIESGLDRDILQLIQASKEPRSPEGVLRELKKNRPIKEEKFRDALFRLMNLKLILLTADFRLTAPK